MDLILYINGHNSISTHAIENTTSICSSINRCSLHVIDLQKNPDIRIKENILATPLLVRKQPQPEIRIVGEFTNKKKIISFLQTEETGHQNDSK